MSDFTTRLPKDLYRAAQVRELDRLAIDDGNIPGFTLMRRAGAAVCNGMRERWPDLRRIEVFAGSGNNGGDGHIVAGLARELGIGAELIEVGAAPRPGSDAAQAREWAREKGVTMVDFSDFQARSATPGHAAGTLIVDGLLGTGLDREVTGHYREAIDRINQSGAPVVAIDVPSGLDADTGMPLGAAVQADLTVTFVAMKQGLLTGQARDFTGDIIFDSLDVPDEVYTGAKSPRPAARRIDINDTARHLPPRAVGSHKGNHGHVVVVGGDHGYGGAGLMAAEAAQRCGAGLVTLLTRPAHRSPALARRPEIMVQGVAEDATGAGDWLAAASVIAAGPGLGRSDWSRKLLRAALAEAAARAIPLVIDADALHLLAERDAAPGSESAGPSPAAGASPPPRRIFTPHPGEAAALLGRDVAAVQADRFAAVTELQARLGGCCLLKGSGSLLCCGGSTPELYLCTEGNAGMASGGMGDVLTGLIAGLLAQGLSARDSLCCAVCIHGEAADLAAQQGGERGMLATDLLPFVRRLVNPGGRSAT